jgi:hypothetical protein
VQSLAEHLEQDAPIDDIPVEVALADDAVDIELLPLLLFVPLDLFILHCVAAEVLDGLTLAAPEPGLESKVSEALHLQVAENAELALQLELGELEAP